MRSDSWLLVCSSSACWFSSVACEARSARDCSSLVGGAQLFLLHLQLLVELLGLGQRVLQLLAIAHRADRAADAGGHQLEQLQGALVGRVRQPELDHAVDDAVVLHRQQHRGYRRHVAEARVDPKVVGRHRLDPHQPPFGRRLPHQALVR